MYNNLQLVRKYLQYYFSASNGQGHGIHSPFVFRFITCVLQNKEGFDPGPEVEQLRKEMLSQKEMLCMEDLGAGSRKGSSEKKSIAQVASASLKPRKLAQMLFRLARYYQPSTIIELGTSLGITTAYFSKAVPGSRVITIEGNNEIAGVASENFRKLGSDNIQLIRGNFDEVLPGVLESIPSVDLAYIDGNHRYQPTMNYFSMLSGKSHQDTILVFDDIHWSREMEKAWNEIKAHHSVKYTIDIFHLGFVFFKSEFKVRQDFVIRF